MFYWYYTTAMRLACFPHGCVAWTNNIKEWRTCIKESLKMFYIFKTQKFFFLTALNIMKSSVKHSPKYYVLLYFFINQILFEYCLFPEYRIPGTAAPDGSCSFTYRSSSRKKGEFNSPRYPSNYPSETNCTYMFLATPNEQVTIVFEHFKVKADSVNTTTGAYGWDYSTILFQYYIDLYFLSVSNKNSTHFIDSGSLSWVFPNRHKKAIVL